MIITEAKYFKIPDRIENGATKTFPNSSITCKIDGVYWGVPIDLENTHYQEIKRQIDAGTLTVEAAD